MNQSIPVLVTGVSGGSIGEQVCKALRFGQNTYQIIATNTTLAAMSVVKAEQYALLPPATSELYITSLLQLIEKFQTQFVIPGSEPELIVQSQQQSKITQNGVHLLVNAQHVIATCVDKRKTFEALSSHGFRVPATWFIEELNDLAPIASDPPWIIKPAQGGGGSAATFIAQDSKELYFFVEYLLKYGYKPLVQCYIGTADQEYTVGVLHSPMGELVGTVVLQRQILAGLSNRLKIANHTKRRELGAVLAISSGISQGKIVEHPQVQAKAEAIASALKSTGPLNIQGRWDGEDFIPFEINPRFSGTTPMRAMAGFNEPELLIEWYRGRGLSTHVANAKLYQFMRGLSEFAIN